MKMFYTFFVISCIALFVSCGTNDKKKLKSESFFEEQGKHAVLEISPKIIDFGKVKASAQNVLHLSATITNTGTEPLVLYKADVSCGCISVSLDKTPLRVGEIGKVRINVKTEGNNGVFNKAVFIQSNAKNNPEIIRVKGVLTE